MPDPISPNPAVPPDPNAPPTGTQNPPANPGAGAPPSTTALSPEAIAQISSAVASQFEDKFEKMAGSIEDLRALAPLDPEPPAPEGDPPDLESLSRADFGKWIGESIVKQQLDQFAQEHLKPLQDGLGVTSEEGLLRDLKAEVTTAREEHADFNDYAEPMVKLSEKYSNLSVEDVYRLAKASTPKGDAPKAKGEVLDNVSMFGGLRPSIAAVPDAKNMRMNPDEAAEAAFEAVSAKHNAL